MNNIVLVHGAFVDGSGWEGVYKILRRDGYSVSIVQNPTISMRHPAQPCRRYWRHKTAICSRTRQSSPPRSRPTWTQRRQRSGPILKFRGAWRLPGTIRSNVWDGSPSFRRVTG